MSEMKKYKRSEEEESALGKEDGAKFDDGKERFDLLPIYPLWEIVRVYTYGTQKYDDDNWRRGMKWGKLIAAALRHFFKWMMGEKYDDESGLHHLAHCAWQCMALMEYERIGAGEDTRKDKDIFQWMLDNENIFRTKK